MSLHLILCSCSSGEFQSFFFRIRFFGEGVLEVETSEDAMGGWKKEGGGKPHE